jgi:fructose-1,6-bisphosphatase/inositol monophosphatase family enzyme
MISHSSFLNPTGHSPVMGGGLKERESCQGNHTLSLSRKEPTAIARSPLVTLDTHQQKALIDLVRRAAKTEIMPRFRNLGAGSVRVKTRHDDLVTDADVASEAKISKGALEILPEALIIGEEAVAADPSILDKMSDADWAVIIDPVDGTWNFANGLAQFGVILAVTYKGETCFGLLYDPVIDDWIMASRGEGAWFCRPDAAPVRLQTSGSKQYSELEGMLPLFIFPQEQRERLAAQMAAQFGRLDCLKCSCHEYRMLAQGRADFILSPKKNPWDHAAGVLITQEAGGDAVCLDGRPYKPTDHSGPFLVAHNKQSLEALRKELAWLDAK